MYTSFRIHLYIFIDVFILLGEISMKLFTLLVFCVAVLFGAVDINTADKKELTGLNGIGDKKAEAIIAYRDTKCFGSIDELTKVKGIGKKIVEKNKDNLTASKCEVK